MSISNKPNRSNMRWLQMCVLLLALVMLPLGAALAGDYGALEKRLGLAVAEGEITIEQAAKMLEVLRDDDDDDDDDDEDVIAELTEDMEEYGGKLKAAVKNGRISEKDAMKKWNWFLDNEIAGELKEEVTEGEISEKDAMAFWKKIKGQSCAKAKACPKESTKPSGAVDLNMAGRRVRAAVQSGSMTAEQGRAKLAELRKAAAKKAAPVKKAKAKVKKPAACSQAQSCDKAKTCPDAKIDKKTGECVKAATCDKAKTCPTAKAAAAKKAKAVAAKKAKAAGGHKTRKRVDK